MSLSDSVRRQATDRWKAKVAELQRDINRIAATAEGRSVDDLERDIRLTLKRREFSDHKRREDARRWAETISQGESVKLTGRVTG